MQTESNLYLLQDNNDMIRLEPISFESEGEFQALLERFPELIPGNQIDRDEPRRWLLIGREVGIPDSDEAFNRWSLDHLFIDQDGIPTFIEVKRYSDTRIRREVVGQMMDYAANAVSYWPPDLIRRKFDETCHSSEIDPEEKLAGFLGDDRDPENFWEVVHHNLKDGNVRLIFAADRVPSELQRIVEFLNEQMSPTEVLAVEIQRYRGGGLTTHIPRVYGQTIKAQMVKRGEQRKLSGQRRRKWDEDSFFEDVAERLTAEQLEKVRLLYDFFRGNSKIDWGTGMHLGSFNPKFDGLGNIAPVTVWSSGELKFKFSWMGYEPAISFKKIYHKHLKKRGILMNEDYSTDTELTIDEWSEFTTDIMEATESALSELQLQISSQES